VSKPSRAEKHGVPFWESLHSWSHPQASLPPEVLSVIASAAAKGGDAGIILTLALFSMHLVQLDWQFISMNCWMTLFLSVQVVHTQESWYQVDPVICLAAGIWIGKLWMQLIECRFLPRAMRCTWEGSLHPNCVERRCKSSPIDAKDSYEYLFGLFQKVYSCPNVFAPGRMHSTPSTTCFAPKAVPSFMVRIQAPTCMGIWSSSHSNSCFIEVPIS
jgi:hypothetical protein